MLKTLFFSQDQVKGRKMMLSIDYACLSYLLYSLSYDNISRFKARFRLKSEGALNLSYLNFEFSLIILFY